MMTKEAKIGLLLGLVFIVAIAVVLRGVHQSGSEMIDEPLGLRTEGDENVVRPVGETLQDLALRVERSTPLVETPQVTRPVVSQDIGPVVSRESGAGQAVRSPGMEPGGVGPGTGYSLPAGSARQTEYAGDVTRQDRESQEVRYEGELPGTVVEADPGVITPPSGLIDRALERMTVAAPVAPLVMAGGEQIRGGKVMPSELVSAPSKTYVVSENDNLTRIALTMYGPVEGKRWANVQRIYEANRQTLASMDDVQVGQELVIPALAGTSTPVAAGTTESPSVAPVSKPKRSVTREYVVKEGDSLWKIAERELGNGARFSDIAALNAKQLSDERSISPGMRLRLPN